MKNLSREKAREREIERENGREKEKECRIWKVTKIGSIAYTFVHLRINEAFFQLPRDLPLGGCSQVVKAYA